ncbi:MAG TPA: sugar phosphate isomerase/epimerase family protein [Hanamia sp.]|nr:sugar phosphate isomerase/epimerase family protein [Hanamia sp.]
MGDFNRRKFLKASTLLMAAPFAPKFFDVKKTKPLLSFSTLGCPDWDFKKITDFAVQHHYEGLEIRGLLRQMDLTKCPEFSTQNIAATLALMKDKNLAFSDLGASTSLHIADSAQRKKNLDEGKHFIDLAQKINCPHVRVFPNNLPKDQDKNKTMDLITKGLLELGDYAKGSNVSVLMETHGDLVWSDDIKKIMESAFNKNTGLVWDVANMWSITKEPPTQVYPKLKKYIRHTHIKDLKMIDGKEHYTLLGEGEVPIFTAVDLLAKGRYKGYYSFEWEKLWHPEIADPEIAIAQYSKVMLEHFGE